MPSVVSVPVATSCLPAETPAMPSITPNTELAALDDRGLVLRIASERLDLIAYARQAEALILACK